MPDAARPSEVEKPSGKLVPRLMLIAIFGITLLSIFGGQIFLRGGQDRNGGPTSSTSTTVSR